MDYDLSNGRLTNITQLVANKQIVVLVAKWF